MAAGWVGAEDNLHGTVAWRQGETDWEDNHSHSAECAEQGFDNWTGRTDQGTSGSTELYFKVRDEDSKMTVDLISRPVKLSVGRELITYLKERPDLEFRIN